MYLSECTRKQVHIIQTEKHVCEAQTQKWTSTNRSTLCLSKNNSKDSAKNNDLTKTTNCNNYRTQNWHALIISKRQNLRFTKKYKELVNNNKCERLS